MANPTNQGKNSFLDKFKNSLSGLKNNEKLENTFTSATENTRDTISYFLLIVGVILLFFQSFYGGILVGLISGFYFSAEILALIENINHLIQEQGIVKSLIGAGLILALFISAPWIFVGAAIAVAIRKILFPEK